MGAGGLWRHLETTTRDAGAQVELTHNQRARDPADRRDQARFRNGHAEPAIRSYADRDRVHIHPDHARAEDHAFGAAHTDQQAGKTTIVIAQTSNEHLDQLSRLPGPFHTFHQRIGARRGYQLATLAAARSSRACLVPAHPRRELRPRPTITDRGEAR